MNAFKNVSFYLDGLRNIKEVTKRKLDVFKGKWQQKFLSFYLKEIQKQCIEVNYNIFVSVLLREIFSPKSTNCPLSWVNF